MDGEIGLIDDGDDGLLVIGDTTVVERFLASEGLTSKTNLFQQVKPFLGTGAAAAQAGSELMANSSNWLKLTEDAAHLRKKYGLRNAAKTGRPTGVILGPKGGGKIGAIAEFEKRSLLNPAALSGVAGMLAQAAVQQAIAEATALLAKIDVKISDVLANQTDNELSGLRGVGHAIERAMTLRNEVGRVTNVTWSTVQDAPSTIAAAQDYAVRRLHRIAEKLEQESDVSALAKTVEEEKPEVRTWLAVLVYSFQLQDEHDLLQLDRERDDSASPEELDAHRRALKRVRYEREDLIARSTEFLLTRITGAADRANAKVLLYPTAAPAVVDSSNYVAAVIHEFREHFGIGSGHQPRRARRWTDAAKDPKDWIDAAKDPKALIDVAKENAPAAAIVTTGSVVVGLALNFVRKRVMNG